MPSVFVVLSASFDRNLSKIMQTYPKFSNWQRKTAISCFSAQSGTAAFRAVAGFSAWMATGLGSFPSDL